MKLRLSVFSLLLTLAFGILPALAAQATAPTPSTEGKKVRAGKTVYDFEEVDILGQLRRPEGQEIKELPEIRFQQILDLDESFLPNIVRSVDEF